MDHFDFIEQIEQFRPNIEKLCGHVALPRMRLVRQSFPREEVADISALVRAELDASGMRSRIAPDARIAVCVGSRGLAGLTELVRATVDWVREAGGCPFVMPAMGSHGGATSEGQAAMLAELGVSPESVGAPVVSNLETRVIGAVRDVPVHLSTDILQSDGCILVCRVKPHTDFRGPYESGLMKMLAIGAGKHNGALAAHQAGVGVFAELIPAIGSYITAHAPILGGVASIENAYYTIAGIRALPAETFLSDEPALLREAFRLMGKIWLDNLDVLMVDEIGKNYSGEGMDPNITGTFGTPYASGGITAESRIVFRLSEATHGNAAGLGMADFTTVSAFRGFDPVSSYTNALTSRSSVTVRIPIVMPDEHSAVRMAIYKSVRQGALAEPRIVHIANTEHIEYIAVSEALWEETENHDLLAFAGDPFSYACDQQGTLSRVWPWLK